MTSKRKPLREQTTARKNPKHAPATASIATKTVPNSPTDDERCVAEIASEIVRSIDVYDLEQFCCNSSGSPQKGFQRLSMSKIRQLLQHKFKIGTHKLARLLPLVRETVGSKCLPTNALSASAFVEGECEESDGTDGSDMMGSSHVSCSDLSDDDSEDGELVFASKRSRRRLLFTDEEDSDCAPVAFKTVAIGSENAVIGERLIRRVDISTDRSGSLPSAGLSVDAAKKSSSSPSSSSSSEALPAANDAAAVSLVEVHDVGDDKVDLTLVRSVDAIVAVIMDQYAIDGALLSDQQFLRQVPSAREVTITRASILDVMNRQRQHDTIVGLNQLDRAWSVGNLSSMEYDDRALHLATSVLVNIKCLRIETALQKAVATSGITSNWSTVLTQSCASNKLVSLLRRLFSITLTPAVQSAICEISSTKWMNQARKVQATVVANSLYTADATKLFERLAVRTHHVSTILTDGDIYHMLLDTDGAGVTVLTAHASILLLVIYMFVVSLDDAYDPSGAGVDVDDMMALCEYLIDLPYSYQYADLLSDAVNSVHNSSEYLKMSDLLEPGVDTPILFLPQHDVFRVTQIVARLRIADAHNQLGQARAEASESIIGGSIDISDRGVKRPSSASEMQDTKVMAFTPGKVDAPMTSFVKASASTKSGSKSSSSSSSSSSSGIRSNSLSISSSSSDSVLNTALIEKPVAVPFVDLFDEHVPLTSIAPPIDHSRGPRKSGLFMHEVRQEGKVDNLSCLLVKTAKQDDLTPRVMLKSNNGRHRQLAITVRGYATTYNNVVSTDAHNKKFRVQVHGCDPLTGAVAPDMTAGWDGVRALSINMIKTYYDSAECVSKHKTNKDVDQFIAGANLPVGELVLGGDTVVKLSASRAPIKRLKDKNAPKLYKKAASGWVMSQGVVADEVEEGTLIQFSFTLRFYAYAQFYGVIADLKDTIVLLKPPPAACIWSAQPDNFGAEADGEYGGYEDDTSTFPVFNR